jgi:Porin subfamily
VGIYSAIFRASAISVCIFSSTVVSATPLLYVHICSLYGAGFFYIPGTDRCLNADTGEIRFASADGTQYTESDLRRNVDRALEGVAIATALPTAIIEPGKTFAIAGSWGNYNSSQWGAFGDYKPAGFSASGFNAIGTAGAMRINQQLQLNAAVAVGLSGKAAASRVGFNYSW